MAATAAARLQICAMDYANTHLTAAVSASELADASVSACAQYAQRVENAMSITNPVSAVGARKDAERAASDAVMRFVASGATIPPTPPPHKGETEA
jgi:hypothetical protein